MNGAYYQVWFSENRYGYCKPIQVASTEVNPSTGNSNRYSMKWFIWYAYREVLETVCAKWQIALHGNVCSRREMSFHIPLIIPNENDCAIIYYYWTIRNDFCHLRTRLSFTQNATQLRLNVLTASITYFFNLLWAIYAAITPLNSHTPVDSNALDYN